MTYIEIARAVALHGPQVYDLITQLLALGDKEATLDDLQTIRKRVNKPLEDYVAEAQERRP